MRSSSINDLNLEEIKKQYMPGKGEELSDPEEL
jgi:hypothetical protein